MASNIGWAASTSTLLSESLSLVAELAIALAGFASLVTIIGRRQGREDRVLDAIRLRSMLEFSLLTAAFALLPLVPFHAGLSQNSTWRLCAALFAGSGGLYSIYWFRRLSDIADYQVRRPWTFLWISLSVSAVVVLLAVATGWLPKPEAAYLWGLYAYLSIAALIFLRLVRSLLEGDRQ